MSYQHRVECEQLRHKLNAALQRAEAAEAEYSYMGGGARYWHDEYCAQQHHLVAKIVALEAKLAELENQEPVGTVSIAMDWNTHRNIATVNMRPDLVLAEMKDGDELFTRPAPAINLAELVPESPTRDMFRSVEWRSEHKDGLESYHTENLDRMWGRMRRVLLRNIEGEK